MPTKTTITMPTPVAIEATRFPTVAEATAFAHSQGWVVFVRGAKKANAFVPAETPMALILAGAEGDRYWAVMRQVTQG